MRRRVRAKTVTLRDPDPHRPLLDLTSSASVASHPGHGRGRRPLPRSIPGSSRSTSTTASTRRRTSTSIRARHPCSSSTAAVPGRARARATAVAWGRRAVHAHYEASEHMSREYTVTRVTHTGVAPRLAQGAARGGALLATYENRFEQCYCPRRSPTVPAARSALCGRSWRRRRWSGPKGRTSTPTSSGGSRSSSLGSARPA